MTTSDLILESVESVMDGVWHEVWVGITQAVSGRLRTRTYVNPLQEGLRVQVRAGVQEQVDHER